MKIKTTQLLAKKPNHIKCSLLPKYRLLGFFVKETWHYDDLIYNARFLYSSIEPVKTEKYDILHNILNNESPRKLFLDINCLYVCTVQSRAMKI